MPKFGLDTYDQLRLDQGEIWDVGNRIKLLNLSQGRLYIKTLKNDWQLFLENVRSFDAGSLLCVCLCDSTHIYSFDLDLINTFKMQMQKVSAGARHFIAFDFFGRVWGFGSNLHGQLGIDGMQVSHWILNETLEGLKTVDVAAGDLFSLFLTSDGIVYSCGSNTFGQLGEPLVGFEVVGQNLPCPVFESAKGVALQLAAGSRHSLILMGNHVYGSGWSKYGQLGEYTAKVQGFKHIFTNLQVLKVEADNWESILEINDVHT